jgi:hypothetical protein
MQYFNGTHTVRVLPAENAHGFTVEAAPASNGGRLLGPFEAVKWGQGGTPYRNRLELYAEIIRYTANITT